MKILLRKDKTINNTLLGHVQLQIEDVYKDLGIEWAIEEVDYSDYPTEVYWGGYWGIQRAWLRTECEKIHARWGKEIDQVVFLIASDNWRLTGVWGWNMSAQFSGYGVQQVRFAQVKNHSDQRNINNSAGTLYHELHHDHDTYIFNHTGEVVERIVNVPAWDAAVTHGEHPNWSYIRTTNDNRASITAIMPALKKARDTRKILFLTHKVTLLQRIQQLMVQLRALQSQVRGDIPILEDNTCTCYTK